MFCERVPSIFLQKRDPIHSNGGGGELLEFYTDIKFDVGCGKKSTTHSNSRTNQNPLLFSDSMH